MPTRQQIEWMLTGAMLASKKYRDSVNLESFNSPECKRLAGALVSDNRPEVLATLEDFAVGRKEKEGIVEAIFRMLRELPPPPEREHPKPVDESFALERDAVPVGVACHQALTAADTERSLNLTMIHLMMQVCTMLWTLHEKSGERAIVGESGLFDAGDGYRLGWESRVNWRTHKLELSFLWTESPVIWSM